MTKPYVELNLITFIFTDQTLEARLGTLYNLTQHYENNPSIQNAESINSISTILSDIASIVTDSNKTLTRMVNQIVS